MINMNPWPSEIAPEIGCVVTVQTAEGELVSAMYMGENIWKIGVDNDPEDRNLEETVTGWMLEGQN